MKKFSFPLDRVLDWRRTQARVEESKLERLHAALRKIEARRKALDLERRQTDARLLAERAATGQELAALDAFRKHLRSEQARLAQARHDCSNKLTAQMQAVTARRRDVRLLEKLKQKKLELWTSDWSREIDHQATEVFLAKRNPSGVRLQ